MFNFNILKKDNYILLEVSGRLMIHEDAQKMQNEILNKLNNQLNTVIINFKELEYFNSSGLNALITILTKTRNYGGDTIITNISESVNQLLLISKLNTVFNIKPELKDVIAAYEKVNK